MIYVISHLHCLCIGVFWMDWSSLLEFFDVAYMNWKPDIFRHKLTIHE